MTGWVKTACPEYIDVTLRMIPQMNTKLSYLGNEDVEVSL
jgi:hypothetical protein